MSSAAVVIPARYASKRFPGKLLAPLAGRPVLVHVIERARAARIGGRRVVVATDDPRILEVARAAGADARLTDPGHRSGTDRVAEVARTLDAEIVINLQGDEPLVPPAALDTCAQALLDDPGAGMATLAHLLARGPQADDPNAVKVVRDGAGRALYFSRAPIPHGGGGAGAPLLRHVGIYAYRRAVLLRLAGSPATPLERAERLEQLRALELGVAIRVEIVDWEAQGVDTPADLERVAALLRARPAADPGPR